MSCVLGFLAQFIALPPFIGVNVRAPSTTFPLHSPLGVSRSRTYISQTSSTYESKYFPLGPSFPKPARQGESIQASSLTQALNSLGASLRNVSNNLLRDWFIPTFLPPNSMVMGMQKASTCVVFPFQVSF